MNTSNSRTQEAEVGDYKLEASLEYTVIPESVL